MAIQHDYISHHHTRIVPSVRLLKSTHGKAHRYELSILPQYQKKLSRLRTAIVTANHVNQKFTSDTLGYLNDAVTLICNGITSDPTYNTTSQEQRNKSIPALVSREV